MKIEEITKKDLDRKSVFKYIDNENKLLKEVKIKRGIVPKNSGYYLISGKIKILDGTIYLALLGISSDDSGELFEVYFYIGNKLVSQEDKLFLERIRKQKNEIFPYKYHLNVKVGGDIHKQHQF